MKIIKTENIPSKFLWSHLFRNVLSDHIFESAATLSYYFLFSVFPLTILASASISTFRLNAEDMEGFQNLIPPQIIELLSDYLAEISLGNPISLMLIGFLLTVYSMGKAIQTLKRKFRIAYRSTAGGSLFREWIVSSVFVLLMICCFFATLILVVAGNHIFHRIFQNIPAAAGLSLWLGWLRYFVLTAFLFFVLFGLYYVLPGIRQKVRDALPGTFFALAAWLISSWGFSFYVDRIVDYTTLYGSLGTIILLLSWLFLINVILLLGVYLNANLKRS